MTSTVSILKFATIFVAGAFCAIFILSLILQSRETKVLGARTQKVESVQGKVQKLVDQKEQEQLGGLAKIFNNAISAIEESPFLAPIFKTSNEVNTAIDSVKNLPTDQRKAICSQVCPN
ncbi:MAG: hypothetical protein HY376_00385 [Candidatus Blackburnbacteria bacterium]|nr:hypothetical protein [Candidatus Blackburnbacteria bacterium]